MRKVLCSSTSIKPWQCAFDGSGSAQFYIILPLEDKVNVYAFRGSIDGVVTVSKVMSLLERLFYVSLGLVS